MANPKYFDAATRTARREATKSGHTLGAWANSGFGHYSASCKECGAGVKVLDDLHNQEARIEGTHREACRPRWRPRSSGVTESRRDPHPIGSRWEISHGSGVFSGHTATVIKPELDHRGVPKETGAYNTFRPREEVMLQSDKHGTKFTMFRNRLRPPKTQMEKVGDRSIGETVIDLVSEHGVRVIDEITSPTSGLVTEGKSCGMCGGEGMLLGALGNRKHFRCRNCGMDFSTATKKRPVKRADPKPSDDGSES